MRVSRPLLTVATVIIVVGLYARAQTAQPHAAQPSASQAPILEVESNEVSLDIVVRDKNNKHPVLNLQPGDLAVTDDGKPVKLTSLRLVTAPAAGEHLVTLVFDHVNSGVIPYEREVAKKFLKAYPPGSFRFAITAIDDRLRLLQDFTTDRDLLLRAVEAATRVEAGTPPESATAEQRLISVAQTGASTAGEPVGEEERKRSQLLLNALTGSQRIVKDEHPAPSLASLEALTEAQKDVRGRKIVVYFTAGLSRTASKPGMIESIVGIANKAGVSLYVIDASALDTVAANKQSYALLRNIPDFSPCGTNSAASPVIPLSVPGHALRCGPETSVTSPLRRL